MAKARKQRGTSVARRKKQLETKERGPNPNRDKILFPEINEPPKDLDAYTIAVYGEKGIGKTTLAASIIGDEGVIVNWEPGRKNLRVRQVPQQGERGLTWPRFKEYCELFIKRGTPCIALDNFDLCYYACFDYVLSQLGLDYPPQKDYGRTWRAIRDELESTIFGLMDGGVNVLFTCHATLRQETSLNSTAEALDRKSRQDRGEVIEEPEDSPMVIQPWCAGAAFNLLKVLTDLCIYYGYVGKNRCFTVRGSDTVFAAQGIEDKFLTLDGFPIVSYLCGDTPKASYKSLLSGFDNKIIDPYEYMEEE